MRAARAARFPGEARVARFTEQLVVVIVDGVLDADRMVVHEPAPSEPHRARRGACVKYSWRAPDLTIRATTRRRSTWGPSQGRSRRRRRVGWTTPWSARRLPEVARLPC